MKKRVLIIGAGLRVKSAIIPALHCLKETFETAAVYSRSAHDLSLLGGRFRMTTIQTLETVDLAKIDLIMVAVTISEVPNVLKALAGRDTRHIVLMLDTPILPLKGLLAIRYFKRFKKVLASEDTIALPPFLLAQKLIGEGRIGKVKNIYFFHNGYKYHALASLRMLADCASLPFIIGRKFGEKIMQKEFFFRNGVRAVLYEPRDYDNCKFVIEGETGIIADREHAGDAVLRIGYVADGPVYKGLTLNGEPVAENQTDAAYRSQIGDDVYEASLMNTMKVRALMDLVVASCEEHSPSHYPATRAIMDNAAILASEKLGYF